MLVLRMRFFQDELLNLAACRLGRFFKEQSFLIEVEENSILVSKH
jgi:hypothetical protein